MNNDSFPGSRWWKFDFHTHTPKSNDYGRGDTTLKNRTPEDWLLDFMRAGFDAVAVTDHNSGEWIGELKAAHEKLAAQPHAEFRPIARAQGALIIPAHVDDPQNALWREDPNTLCRLIEHRDLFAWERRALTSSLPSACANCKKPFAEVLGSDAHKPASIGKQFTWVKMSRPNLEGLRLALLDGDLCLQRSDKITGDPNAARAALMIESFKVEKAQFMGRVTPFVLEFNPWMNAIIGARGTGKSSLLEFMRIALRREGGLKSSEELDAEFHRKYAAEWQGRTAGGLQMATTRLRLIYRKDGGRFRVNFARDASLPAIEEEGGAGGWKPAQGGVASRFPVRIYSQKQVFELAGTPSALLGIY